MKQAQWQDLAPVGQVVDRLPAVYSRMWGHLLLAEMPVGIVGRYCSICACIMAQVLVRFWVSADPDCCNYSDKNLNLFSAGVVAAEVDGVTVELDGDADVWFWWTACCSQARQMNFMPLKQYAHESNDRTVVRFDSWREAFSEKSACSRIVVPSTDSHVCSLLALDVHMYEEWT